MKIDITQGKQIKSPVACLIICLFCFFLYGKTFFYGLTWLDDKELLEKAIPAFQNLSEIVNFFKNGVFPQDENFLYRPLLNITFLADLLLHGTNWHFSHLINIVLHSFAVCIFYFFLLSFGVRNNISFLSSVFFAAHPAAAIVAAWLPGRNDSLLAIFSLSAFIFLSKWLKGKKSILYPALYSLCLCGALLSKENAIAIPVLSAVFFIFDILKKGSIPSKRKIFHFLLLILIPVFLWHILRHNAIQKMSSLPPVLHLLENMPYIPLIAGRALFPSDISVMSKYAEMPSFYGIIPLILIALFMADIKQILKKGGSEIKKAIFGVSWFILFLAPAMISGNGISFSNAFIDHRLYLPLAGLILAGLQIKIPNKARLCVFYFVFSLFLMCAALSNIRCSYYESRESLWEQINEDCPGFFDALCTAGLFNEERMLYGEAIYYFKKAAAIKPKYKTLHLRIALLEHKKGNLENARKEIEQELILNPDSKDAKKILDKLSLE